MRMLAVAAALTLALAAPASGAPVHPRSGAHLAAMGAGAGIRADPAPSPGPTGFVPRLLTAVLGLVAAALAARVVLRTRRLQDQQRPPHRGGAPDADAPPDPDPTPTRRR